MNVSFSIRARLAAVALVLSAGAISPARAAPCLLAPVAIRDIHASRGDGWQTVSPDANPGRAGARSARVLSGFVTQLAALSDRYVTEQDAAAGQCAVSWIARWASQGALLGRVVYVGNDAPDYLRQWAYGGIAIAYLKTRRLAGVAQREQIETWLAQVAQRDQTYWDNPDKAPDHHYYWSGVGVMASALASGDGALLARARSIYRRGINDIHDDGSLPLEMRRGKDALRDHNCALAPLVLMAEMSHWLGQDWYGYNNNRIDLLADRVAQGYQSSAWFAQQAGARQVALRPDGELGWVEFYRLRALAPERFESLHNAGPYDAPRLGGDLSTLAQMGWFDRHP